MIKVDHETIDVLRPCKCRFVLISVSPENMRLFYAFDFLSVADKRARKFRNDPIRINPNFDLEAWKAKVIVA